MPRRPKSGQTPLIVYMPAPDVGPARDLARRLGYTSPTAPKSEGAVGSLSAFVRAILVACVEHPQQAEALLGRLIGKKAEA